VSSDPGDLPARRTVRRPLLDRRAVVDEALRLIRREGLDAVTMRRLADELATSPMSLYRHVEDRQDLLVAMLDAVAAGIDLPPVAGDPRAEITAVITAIHDALRRDPWAVELIVSDKLAGPSILPAIDRIFAALTKTGLQPRDVSVGYALLWHYTAGELIDSHHERAENYGRAMVRAADPERYPALTSIVSQLPPGPPSDHFAENVQRLLDGLIGRTVPPGR
jgi:AcrR family transcriptional regulator